MPSPGVVRLEEGGSVCIEAGAQWGADCGVARSRRSDRPRRKSRPLRVRLKPPANWRLRLSSSSRLGCSKLTGMSAISWRAALGSLSGPLWVLALAACTDLADSGDFAAETSLEEATTVLSQEEEPRAEEGQEEGGQEEEAGEPEPGADWSCLPAMARGQGRSVSGRQIEFRIRFVSLLGGAAPPNIRVRACTAFDVSCDVSEPGQAVVPAADGYVRVSLDYGFEGFLVIRADGVIPVKFYPAAGMTEDTTYPVDFGLAPQGALDALAEASGATFEAEAAHLTVQAHDCSGVRAAGVVFEHNHPTPGLEFYYSDGVPGTVPQATDARGIGGFVNLAASPLNVSISGSRAGDSEVVGGRTVTMRGGWFTTVDIAPN